MLKRSRVRITLVGLLAFGLMGCIEKETVAEIGDAENLLITSDQQLLVSGGDNIYRVYPDTGNDGPDPLFLGNERIGQFACNFTGIAQHGHWVFTSCVQRSFLIFTNNHLLAADLREDTPEFKVITPLRGADPYDTIGLPNGLAFAPDGALLVADYDLLYKSGIARITLDYSGERPAVVDLEKNFVSPQVHGLNAVNGIRVVDDLLYLSDVNSVKRLRFDAQSRIPAKVLDEAGNEVSNVATMWSGGLAIVDDIMPLCDGVALTSYLTGSLHYVASYADAQRQEHFPELYASPPFAFESPSALAKGDIPGVFDGDSLLVTEKGLLGDLTSRNGNRVSRASLSMDLNAPGLCHDIQVLAREAVEG